MTWLRLIAVGLAAGVLLAPRSLAAQSGASPAPVRADTPPSGLSLGDALKRAESVSEAVGIARQEVRRTEGERMQARSGYFPQISGAASYTKTLRSQFSSLQSSDSASTDTSSAPASCATFTPEPGNPAAERLDSLESAVKCLSTVNPFAAFSNLPFGRENAYSLGLSASQTLFDGGRTAGQSRAASAQLQSAKIGLTAAQAQLLLDVTQAYYDALLGDQLAAIAESTLVEADSTLSQTRLAQQVGNQSEFDLLRAQVSRDNQVPLLIQRRSDRDLAYLRLKQLLDLPIDEPLQLTSELGDTALVATERIRQLVEAPGDTTIDARAPVRQAAQGVEAQSGLLGAAHAQYWPSLVLSSQFAELNYPTGVLSGWGGWLSNWTVTLGLQVPLFTGGRIHGSVMAARANVEEARLRLKQVQQLARLDSRNAANQYQAALATWRASQGTEAQAAQAYRIAELRYREGISTQLELSDARLLMEQARTNRAQAARNLQVAKMRLALLPALPLQTAGTGASAQVGAGGMGGMGGMGGTGGTGQTQTTPSQAGTAGTQTLQTGAVGP